MFRLRIRKSNGRCIPYLNCFTVISAVHSYTYSFLVVHKEIKREKEKERVEQILRGNFTGLNNKATAAATRVARYTLNESRELSTIARDYIPGKPKTENKNRNGKRTILKCS